MELKQVKRILEISQEIIHLAEQKSWDEAELMEAIDLLSSKTSLNNGIDNKEAVKDFM